jgi:alpha-L-glutamate ligase-like protein
MIGWVERLRRNGVLGINARNILYQARYNDRRRQQLVDDKRRTKELAAQAGIPVPATYGVIETPTQVRALRRLVGTRERFVVKPAHGSKGNGILVIDAQLPHGWRLAGGQELGDDEVHHRLDDVVSGLYSLAGQPDCALLEYRVESDPLLAPIACGGVPDLRVLVFRGVPVMAMLRLPTHESAGKANLHQGGIGVGIELCSGMTRHGVHHDQAIDRHPDTGCALAGLKLPAWRDILVLAARCADLTGLGYLGVDIVLDRDLGPLMLELNARPGLAIQIANRCGLRRRLADVDACVGAPMTVDQRVELALALDYRDLPHCVA